MPVRFDARKRSPQGQSGRKKRRNGNGGARQGARPDRLRGRAPKSRSENRIPHGHRRIARHEFIGKLWKLIEKWFLSPFAMKRKSFWRKWSNLCSCSRAGRKTAN